MELMRMRQSAARSAAAERRGRADTLSESDGVPDQRQPSPETWTGVQAAVWTFVRCRDGYFHRMSEEQTEVEETEEKDEQESGDKDTMDSEEVDKQIKEVEENPPDKLEDWPGGQAKYRTIGGGDANEEWEEGPTKHLGPSDVRYYEDGSVTVAGEKVDNPEDFKGDPIPGGPTDPDAPDDPSGIEPENKGDDDEESNDGVEGSAAGGGDESREDDDSEESDD
jgi:hypothetical protein